MASYIQGLTDYIPQVERFKPDLNFYATVLQNKQSKYDAAKKKLGSLYGSLLYAPLTHDGNIERRDSFFKMIEQDIKKISGMDLSLPQNVDAASDIFKPLIDDPYISYDMAYTKTGNNEIDRGNSFRDCTDPDKCNGEFWEEGITAVRLKMQDFANAKLEDTIKMAPPRYAPFINVPRKAIDYANKLGLNVTNVSSDGQYLVTVKNGKQLLVPLQYMYAAVFGKDPSIKAMNDAKAYLSRKNYIFQNKEKFNGDENLAEEEYFKKVLDSTGQTLKDDILNVKGISKDAGIQRRAIENKIKRDGVTTNSDDPMYKLYMNTIGDDEAAKGTETYYDQLENQFNKLSNNSKDRDILRSQIDVLVGNGFLNEDISKSAIAYAATHSEITKVADPYAMKMFEHQLNMEEKRAQVGLDLVKEKLKMDMEYGMFTMMNGTYNQAAGMPLGPGAGSATKAGEIDLLGEETGLVTGYRQAHVGQRTAIQKDYIQTIADSARAIIQDSGTSPEEKMAAKATLRSIFKDKFDAESGRFKTPEGTLTDYWTEAAPNATAMNNLFEAAKTHMPSSAILNAVYNNQLVPMENHLKRFADREEAAISLWSDNNKTTLNAGMASPDVRDKTAFSALFDRRPNGQMVPKSKEHYIEDYLKMVKGWSRSVSEGEKREHASEAYDDAFSMYKTLYNNGAGRGDMKHIRSLLGTPLDDGGVTSNRVGFNIDAGKPGTMQGFLSFWQNAQGPAFLKAVQGADMGNKNNAYDKANNESNMMDLFNQFAYDAMNKRYKKGSTEARPAGTMIYHDVAANKGDVIAVTLKPDMRWMAQHATGSKAKNELQAFGIPQSRWGEGVTVYLKKGEANNLLTDQFKHDPDAVIFAANKPYNISTPLGGNASILKNSDGTIKVTGEFRGLKTNPKTGKLDWYVRQAESIVPQGGNAVDVAHATEIYLNDLNKSNYDYLTRGVGETKLKDPNVLLKHIQQTGGSDNMEFIMQMQQLFGF